ncbi:NUDIX hydrolase [Naasia lichenicola]|uniref:NUDIX hydrolase n=2 Tax=Naasia lichenicola TaxID=2565933 RepID=A0A4S4FT77_9MICO|nr:NUDIX hydrolase [Naasia lichenicola]THG33634.1 NUDIX hydrolase [Naasia lichenicola]
MPRRPLGSGDEWVMLPDGRRFWGAFGAAGLLVHAPDAGVLLQHRAGYSHFGGTWGLPGGARHSDESAVEGAIREAAEEAGVPGDRLRVQFTSVLDLDVWTYTTVVASVEERFEPVIGDAESIALAWVPIDEVDDLPLHPGFAASWPELRAQLRAAPTLIIDAANVVGSRPDAWWKDRPGAAQRLAASLERLAARGVPAALLELPGHTWWPRLVLVLEGEAKQATIPSPSASGSAATGASAGGGSSSAGLTIELASTDGDSRIRELVSLAAEHSDSVTVVVTADRALADSVRALGARVVGPRALLELIDTLDS